MNLTEQIKNYTCYDMQEENDKKIILKCLETFNDCLTRNNEISHFACSAFVLNKNKDKCLMVHHNIFNAWTWPGGHADGDNDLLNVAIKEVIEETGVKNVTPITEQIISLNIIAVKGHMKKGNYVSPHLHLSTAFLLSADENEKLIVKSDENSKVQWIPVTELDSYITEPHMMEIYKKIISRFITKEIEEI
jgi:8-oxo-dGTP pyrophosphatase MutT (NUDIX family)